VSPQVVPVVLDHFPAGRWQRSTIVLQHIGVSWEHKPAGTAADTTHAATAEIADVAYGIEHLLGLTIRAGHGLIRALGHDQTKTQPGRTGRQPPNEPVERGTADVAVHSHESVVDQYGQHRQSCPHDEQHRGGDGSAGHGHGLS
jgi:hypothetical protein